MNLTDASTFLTPRSSAWQSPPRCPPTACMNCATAATSYLSSSNGRTNRKRVRHRSRRHRIIAPSQANACSPQLARTAASMSHLLAATLNGATCSDSQSAFPDPGQSCDWLYAGSNPSSYPMSHNAREARIAASATTKLASCCIASLQHETAASRERRIFGGTDDDEPDAGENKSDYPEPETDLRGSMLDVVLRLFDGIDYDDDAMW